MNEHPLAAGTLMAAMGATVETIKENHSSERLFNAVDHCLYSAAAVLLERSPLYQDMVGTLYAANTRKKWSALEVEALPAAIYRLYHADAGANLLDKLRGLRLNRDLVAHPLDLVYPHVDDYLLSMAAGTPTHVEMARSWGFTSPHTDHSAALLRLHGEYSRYLGLRTAILEKYNRYVVKDILKHKYIIAERVDMNDMAVEYELAKIKAFSKYDVSSGAFTAYFQMGYFRSARSNSMTLDEMGTAFSINGETRTALAKGTRTDVYNYAVSGEHQGNGCLSEEMEASSEESVLTDILTYCDPAGFYRLLNDHEIDIEREFIHPDTQAHKLSKANQ